MDENNELDNDNIKINDNQINQILEKIDYFDYKNNVDSSSDDKNFFIEDDVQNDNIEWEMTGCWTVNNKNIILTKFKYFRDITEL